MRQRSLTLLVAASFLLAPLPAARGAVIVVQPQNDQQDGVELADSIWSSDGLAEIGGNLGIGRALQSSRVEPAFLFQGLGLVRGDSVEFARLRFASLGRTADDSLQVRIGGLLHCTWQSFSQENRPSRIPPTIASVLWNLTDAWICGAGWDPYYVFSPNIAPVLNELLASPLWPDDLYKTGNFALSVDFVDPDGEPAVLYELADYGTCWPPATLEIYRRLEDAFLAPPLVARSTATSAVVRFSHLESLDCYLAYGLESGEYQWGQGHGRTELPALSPLLATGAQAPVEIRLSGLAPDTRYYGTLRLQRAGGGEYRGTPEFSFHTQRAPGHGFTFDVVADGHLEDRSDAGTSRDVSLYKTALENVAADAPDFAIDLGDFAITLRASLGVRSLDEARRIYADGRALLGQCCPAVPFFFVLGNHEGELGWLDEGDADGIFAWSTMARKEFVPNPDPDDFYSGNPVEDPRFGLPEDYFAWEWGDALFVVLDPFRYTAVKPHHYGGWGSGDGWDWTLGQEQYDWLAQVLRASNRAWKFVFIHHLAGGVLEQVGGPYGRGGIEAVRWSVAHRPTFEWGGQDQYGNSVFQERRPGFTEGDIHTLLHANGVTAVFHGHDHCYVYQQIAGIVYQECPQVSDAFYGPGMCFTSGYQEGLSRPNSGHLRIAVSGDHARVEYVRAFLPGEGENGRVEYGYDFSYPAAVFEPKAPAEVEEVRLSPNPCRGILRLRFPPSRHALVAGILSDCSGRIVSRLPSSPIGPEGELRWELRDGLGRPVPSGIYQIRLGWNGATKPTGMTGRLLVIR